MVASVCGSRSWASLPPAQLMSKPLACSWQEYRSTMSVGEPRAPSTCRDPGLLSDPCQRPQFTPPCMWASLLSWPLPLEKPVCFSATERPAAQENSDHSESQWGPCTCFSLCSHFLPHRPECDPSVCPLLHGPGSGLTNGLDAGPAWSLG